MSKVKSLVLYVPSINDLVAAVLEKAALQFRSRQAFANNLSFKSGPFVHFEPFVVRREPRLAHLVAGGCRGDHDRAIKSVALNEEKYSKKNTNAKSEMGIAMQRSAVLRSILVRSRTAGWSKYSHHQ
jgi:hypothetical protein